MFGKRQITICREGWYFLVVLAFIICGALLREINLLVILTGMMIGPFLFNWFMATATLMKMDVRRKMPVGICAGDLLVVEIESKNRQQRLDAWTVVVEDRIRRNNHASRGGRGTMEVMFAHVPAGHTAATAYRGRLMQRGHYTFGPMKVATRFPLGLIRRSFTVDQIDTLLVCPRLGHLTPKWTRMMESKEIGGQRSRRRHGLVEGDFYGLRNWRSGDSRRWIHWRTSAKRGNLAIRQFEQQRNQNMVVVLDLWQDARATQEYLDSVELAISFAATIVEDLCRRGGSQLAIGIAGKEIGTARGAASIVMLQEVMELLAGTVPTKKDQLPDLLGTMLDEIRPGTRTVIISTRDTDLSDTDRFAAIWEEPRKRSMIGKIACVNTESDELFEYFQVK